MRRELVALVSAPTTLEYIYVYIELPTLLCVGTYGAGGPRVRELAEWSRDLVT